MVSWTRHSAASCICRHGPASLSSPRAGGIAYTFVAIETYPVCVRLYPVRYPRRGEHTRWTRWHHRQHHRLPAPPSSVCRHGCTPQMAHGSLNPRANPIRGQSASQAAPSIICSLQPRCIPHTAGWYLRLTESHPLDLEHFIHTPKYIRQQIRQT